MIKVAFVAYWVFVVGLLVFKNFYVFMTQVFGDTFLLLTIVFTPLLLCLIVGVKGLVQKEFDPTEARMALLTLAALYLISVALSIPYGLR